jgi:hypothetical protein
MLHVVRDDIRRRLIVTGEGQVSFAQLATFVATQLEQGTWGYSVLHDARAASTDWRPEDSRLLLTTMQQAAAGLKRGPVAVVASDEEVRSLVRTHIAMASEIGLRVALFAEVGDAERWLDQAAD